MINKYNNDYVHLDVTDTTKLDLVEWTRAKLLKLHTGLLHGRRKFQKAYAMLQDVVSKALFLEDVQRSRYNKVIESEARHIEVQSCFYIFYRIGTIFLNKILTCRRMVLSNLYQDYLVPFALHCICILCSIYCVF